MIEVCDLGNFSELSGWIVAAVSVPGVMSSMVVPEVTVRACIMQSVTVVQNVVRPGVCERAVIATFCAGVMPDMAGDHAENHVAEAQHGTDDIKCSKCS